MNTDFSSNLFQPYIRLEPLRQHIGVVMPPSRRIRTPGKSSRWACEASHGVPTWEGNTRNHTALAWSRATCTHLLACVNDLHRPPCSQMVRRSISDRSGG